MIYLLSGKVAFKKVNIGLSGNAAALIAIHILLIFLKKPILDILRKSFGMVPKKRELGRGL